MNFFADTPRSLQYLENQQLVVSRAGEAEANGEYRFAGIMNGKGYFEKPVEDGVTGRGRHVIYCCKLVRNDNMRWFLSLVENEALPGGRSDLNLYYSSAFPDSPCLPHAQWDCMTDAFLTDTRIRIDAKKMDAFGRNGDRETRNVSKPVYAANISVDHSAVNATATVSEPAVAKAEELENKREEEMKVDVGDESIKARKDHRLEKVSSEPVQTFQQSETVRAVDSYSRNQSRRRSRSHSRSRSRVVSSRSPSASYRRTREDGPAQKRRRPDEQVGGLSAEAVRRLNPQDIKRHKTNHYLHKTRASAGDAREYL